jgi:hypothetical protein
MEQALRAVFNELASAFSALDLARFRDLYALPAQVVMEGGSVAITDAAGFEQFFLPLAARLREAGFARSVYSDFEFRDLGAGLALASMCWRRLAADGRIIETLGATYILRRTPDWRIVTLIGHTPGRGIGAHA